MDKTKSKFSRRNMLLGIGGATIAAGALIVAPFRTAIVRQTRDLLAGRTTARRTASLALGSYEKWQGQVGSDFAIGGGVALRLAGVRALPSGGNRPRGLARDRAFVAFFDPLGGAGLAGDLIYTVQHSVHGPLQIFLSESGDRRTPLRMLAVFN